MAKNKRNVLRNVLQWGVLIVIGLLLLRPVFDKNATVDVEKYCPFGGIQAFGSFLANNSLACSMTVQAILMGFGLALAALLFSKLFCSYVCPVGTVSEWFGRRGEKFRMNRSFKGLADRLLRSLKYILLFITVYYTVKDSELFCRTFDPYYAVVTGYGHDVNLWYATIALLLVVAGSFFVKQLWCKYFCPVGAVSNLFTFGYVFLTIVIVYIAIKNWMIPGLSWVWLLGALCLAGLILELYLLRFKGTPFLRVTRNAETCTSCRICDKACPMKIKISDKPVVNHIDCHLCADCVVKCPEPDTLQINRRNIHWLPAVLTVAVALLALAFATVTEIPTITRHWGTEQQMEQAARFEMAGLKNVKCFGSSSSFANQMEGVPGVLGVETFVDDFRVVVFYDPAVIDENGIKQAIFSPVKTVIAQPGQAAPMVKVLDVGIDKFFDSNDASILYAKLVQLGGIYAFETMFGEPVHTKIYYDSLQVTPQAIFDAIEQKNTQTDQVLYKSGFKVNKPSVAHGAIPFNDYMLHLYENIDYTFNDYELLNEEQKATLYLPFNGFLVPGMDLEAWNLLSHISNNRGVVGFAVVPRDNAAWLKLEYDNTQTNEAEIISQLNAAVLRVHFDDGTEKEVENPFRF